MSQSVGFRSLLLRVVSALIALVALAFLTVSCSQADTDTDAVSGGAAPTDLLSLVPDGYQEATRWDVVGLLGAKGLEEVQDEFREQWE